MSSILRPAGMRLTLGCLATFYGRHAVFTLLHMQIIHRVPAWRELLLHLVELRSLLPNLRAMNGLMADTLSRLSRLNMELARARQAGNQREASLLEAELDQLQQEMIGADGQISTLVSRVDPDQLMQTLRGILRNAVALSLAAADNGVRSIGVDFDIASTLSSAIRASLAPTLRKLIALVAQRSAAIDSLLKYRTEHDDHAGERWVDMGISAVCSSIGLAVAFHVERALFVASNALWGADLILSALAQSADTYLPARVSNRLFAAAGQPALVLLARWILVGAGAYHQFIGGGRRLPKSLGLILFAPLLIERSVTTATCALRTLQSIHI